MSVKINKEKTAIAAMFNNIAGSYDIVNHILSFGIDKIWRNKLLRTVLKSNPKRALDIACGTGDISIALMRNGIEVTGLDIANEMLEIAKTKTTENYNKYKTKYSNHNKNKGLDIKPIDYVLASADSIPFPDKTYDLVTIGFGIRNFENRGEALLEIRRVLKNGGELAILEFATPHNIVWRAFYSFYFLTILPFIGRLISGDGHAYNYLPSSVASFPQYNEFAQELSQIGYSNIKFKSLTGGVAILYTAKNISK